MGLLVHPSEPPTAGKLEGCNNTAAAPRKRAGELRISCNKVYLRRAFTVSVVLPRVLDEQLPSGTVETAVRGIRILLDDGSEAVCCSHCSLSRAAKALIEIDIGSVSRAVVSGDVVYAFTNARSLCSSSRNHLKSRIVLVVDKIPGVILVSEPIVLLSRLKRGTRLAAKVEPSEPWDHSDSCEDMPQRKRPCRDAHPPVDSHGEPGSSWSSSCFSDTVGATSDSSPEVLSSTGPTLCGSTSSWKVPVPSGPDATVQSNADTFVLDKFTVPTGPSLMPPASPIVTDCELSPSSATVAPSAAAAAAAAVAAQLRVSASIIAVTSLPKEGLEIIESHLALLLSPGGQSPCDHMFIHHDSSAVIVLTGSDAASVFGAVGAIGHYLSGANPWGADLVSQGCLVPINIAYIA